MGLKEVCIDIINKDLKLNKKKIRDILEKHKMEEIEKEVRERFIRIQKAYEKK